MSTEKEDGVCENKLCNLDIKCGTSSNLTQGIDSINVNNNNSTSSVLCANCGKGEEESHKLKSCTACKLVKYCNREYVKLLIVHNIRKSAENVSLNYMMKNYSNNPHHYLRTVQSASCLYQR